MPVLLMNEDIYSKEFVGRLFNRMSKTYGLVNYISSFGFTERWRRQCIDEIDWNEVETGFDLMSGMGETWHMIQGKKRVRLIGLDISDEMNEAAKKKINEYPNWEVELLQEDVLENSIKDNSADFVVSAFGLKTFSNEQLKKLAKEINRVLKQGGQFAFVEISEPNFKPLKWLFMFYLRFIIPIIGKLFTGNSNDYRMLGVYCLNFKNCNLFSDYLNQSGLQIQYKEYFFGCASGVVGIKR